MDLVFVFALPAAFTILVAFSQVLRNAMWALVGLWLVSVIAFGVLVPSDPRFTAGQKVVQVMLFAALPYGALFLASRATLVARHPLIFLVVGPLVYWLSYVVAVNLWLAMGYGL